MTEAADKETRIYGWMLVVASVLALALAMMHPQLSSRDLAGVLREMAQGALFNGWVHGALMALYVVQLAGFAGLSRRLGFGRPEVVLALAAYALGVMALMGAAVINGFGLALFAGRYDGVEPGQAAALGASFNLAGSIAATWAGVGAVATSGAILAWSLRLAASPGTLRIIGVLGMLLGLATIAMLVAGALILDVHGFLLLVLSQTGWTVAVGIQLIRGKL